MKKRVYICGNPLVDEDSMPFRILPVLQKKLPFVDFIEFDPTENFPEDDPLFILDTVINAKEVCIIEDLRSLESAPHVSLHDADLAFHLQWLEKVGKLQQMVIFGVPSAGDENRIIDSLADLMLQYV
jgi:Ni,Fe-hydrogenase maturation factor